MTRNNSTQYIITVLSSVLAATISYLISFLLTPYITENIGTEAYGFVALAKTFAGYAAIATIALNSFFSRFISIEYHRGNIQKANSYYSSIFIADLVFGMAIFLISLIIVMHLQDFLNISNNLVFDTKILFILAFANLLLVSSGTAFTAAAYIKNRLDLPSIVKALAYIIEAIFLVGAFCIFQPKVYYVGIGFILSSSVVVFANYRITRRKTPELIISKNAFSWLYVKKLVVNGIWNSFNSLGNVLNTGLDLLITNLMMSALAMGQLAIVKTVSMIFSALFQQVSQPFQPLLLRSYALSEKENIVKTFSLGIKVCGLFSNIAFAGFIAYGLVYYKLWTPSQDINLLYGVTIVSVLGGIVEGAVYPLYYTYVLTLKNRIPCLVTIAGGVINVMSMYILIKYTAAGLYAVVGTTAVISWVINFIFNPLYSAKCLGIGKFAFYPVLIRHMLSCAIMTLTFKAISTFLYPSDWLGLILCALLCSLAGFCIHLMVMANKGDFAMLKQAYKRKRARE